MIVLMVEMMLMMIPMMPDMMAMMMAVIPPSGREIPRKISPCRSSSLCLVSALWRRRKKFVDTPNAFRSKPTYIQRRVERRHSRGRGGLLPRPWAHQRVGAAPAPWVAPLLVFWLRDLLLSKISFPYFLEFSANFLTLHNRKTPNAILLKTASIRVSSKQFIKNQRQKQ